MSASHVLAEDFKVIRDYSRYLPQVLAEVDSKYYVESGVDVCEYELRVSRVRFGGIGVVFMSVSFPLCVPFAQNMGPEINLEALAQRILVLKGQDLAVSLCQGNVALAAVRGD